MRPRRAFILLTALATAAGIFVRASPARAQQSLIDSDPVVIRARNEVAAAQAAAHEAAARLEATTEQRSAVAAHIADDESRVTALDQQRATLAAWRDQLLAHIRARAVALYQSGGDGTGIADLLAGNALDGVRRKELGSFAARTDHSNARKLESAREQLAVTQAMLRHETADLEQQHQALDALVTQLSEQQALVNQRVEAANAALARARAIGAMHAAGQPVMGPTLLSADQMVAWYNAQGYEPRLDTTVADLAQMYVQEGTDENVRGDVAFAQAIVETGGFASAPGHNYSGLGWCDTCARGTVFPTPRDGIRAQIQLLLNYADAGSRASGLHHPPSPYWWDSDPAVAARDFDTYFAKGWAPTWSDMGHGNWATDPNYAGKVLSVYSSMEAFAGAH
jgi:predicted  nucleic acid-binding Zn-ribbon protein